MQSIFSHIAYLLTQHECVVIPGFGALIHSYVPARNAMDEDIFSPPSISLGFNSELNHNDGILADSIKSERNISYNDANKIVSDFSVKLNDQLKNKKKITIPQVGHFALSEDKKINFSPAADLSANVDQFGFKNFYIPLLSEIATTPEKDKPEESQDNRVIMIPLSKRLLTAASVAAIVLIFMLLSTPIDNKDVPMQYAGMFSSYTPVSVHQAIPVELPEATTDEVVVKDSISELVVSAKESIPEQSLVEQKEEKPVLIVENSPNGYLIIIASFPTRREAERILPDLKKNFDSASIIEKNNRSRIYIRSFQDKKEAEYFLDRFRIENPQHQDAWLLSNKTKS